MRPNGACFELLELDVMNHTKNWLEKQGNEKHNADDGMVATDKIKSRRRLLRHPYTKSESGDVDDKSKGLEKTVNEPQPSERAQSDQYRTNWKEGHERERSKHSMRDATG